MAQYLTALLSRSYQTADNLLALWVATQIADKELVAPRHASSDISPELRELFDQLVSRGYATVEVRASSGPGGSRYELTPLGVQVGIQLNSSKGAPSCCSFQKSVPRTGW